MQQSALDDLTVIELAEGVSGPYCGRMLGAFGAEVIKIEKVPDGDWSRRAAPFVSDDGGPESSGLYLYLNTNKKSITLDWESPTGVDVLKRLVSQADVVIENSPVGHLDRLGLSYEDLHQLNPRLVMVSLTDFGSSGPYRDWQATPLVNLALGGFLYLSGDEDREPLALPGHQPDYLAALHGYMGALMALWARDDTGEGQHVEVATMEVLAALHQFTTVMYTYSGLIRSRHGARWENKGVYGRYPITVLPCKDGYVSFAVSTEPQWEQLCVMIERSDLLDDPRYATYPERRALAEELDEILIDWLKDKTRDEVFHLAAGTWSVPVAPVSDLSEIISDPQFRERGLWTTLDHPDAGSLIYPTLPYNMSESPPVFESAPTLGQHNREVYISRLGYSQAELDRLSELGIV